MITKKGSTKIVYFMTTMARAWPYKPYSEYATSSTLSIHITLIVIALRGNEAAFLRHR